MPLEMTHPELPGVTVPCVDRRQFDDVHASRGWVLTLDESGAPVEATGGVAPQTHERAPEVRGSDAPGAPVVVADPAPPADESPETADESDVDDKPDESPDVDDKPEPAAAKKRSSKAKTTEPDDGHPQETDQ